MLNIFLNFSHSAAQKRFLRFLEQILMNRRWFIQTAGLFTSWLAYTAGLFGQPVYLDIYGNFEISRERHFAKYANAVQNFGGQSAMSHCYLSVHSTATYSVST